MGSIYFSIQVCFGTYTYKYRRNKYDRDFSFVGFTGGSLPTCLFYTI